MAGELVSFLKQSTWNLAHILSVNSRHEIMLIRDSRASFTRFEDNRHRFIIAFQFGWVQKIALCRVLRLTSVVYTYDGHSLVPSIIRGLPSHQPDSFCIRNKGHSLCGRRLWVGYWHLLHSPGHPLLRLPKC
jgi:hypothetical protein